MISISHLPGCKCQSSKNNFVVIHSPHGLSREFLCLTVKSKLALINYLVRSLKVDHQKAEDAMAKLESNPRVEIE
jgi:hypothetical protein